VTKTILALALLVVATAAPDYRSPTGTRVLVKLASYSENAGTCAKPSVFKITLEATNFSFAVGEYRETVPVAADGLRAIACGETSRRMSSIRKARRAFAGMTAVRGRCSREKPRAERRPPLGDSLISRATLCERPRPLSAES